VCSSVLTCPGFIIGQIVVFASSEAKDAQANASMVIAGTGISTFVTNLICSGKGVENFVVNMESSL
jgi:hypothetical protein